MSFTIGTTVGPYQIVQKLGQGGMATVYKGYHTALDRHVAIKVLHPTYTQDDSFLRRFTREARVVARLEHPHIVAVYDYAEHESHPYLVMKYVEGETLKERLAVGALSRSEILRIGTAVANALDYAHGQGVLHRDIKPSNILLTSGSGVFLTDFGLARMAQAGESTLSQDMIMGTPQYISPEQAKGVPNLDGRTDVYSFGIVLYEMMVGRVPFQADTGYSIIHAQIFDSPPLPSSLNTQIGPVMEAVLLKALAKEPTQRYQTAGELMAAFRQAADELPTDVAQRPGVTLLPDYTPLAITKVETAVPPPTTASLPPLPDLTATVAPPVKQRRPIVLLGAGIVAGMLLCVCILFVLSTMLRQGPPPNNQTIAAETPAGDVAGTAVAQTGNSEVAAGGEMVATSTPTPSPTVLSDTPPGEPSASVFLPPPGQIHPIAELRQLLETNPNDISLKAELALALLQNGEIDEARTIVQEVFRPVRLPLGYIVAGEKLMETERFELAILVLEEGHRQFPNSEMIQQLLMMSFVVQRHSPDVVQEFITLLAASESRATQTTRQIGEAYLASQNNQLEQGLNILQETLATADPVYLADVWFLQGWAYESLENFAEARTAYETAKTFQPAPWLILQIDKHLNQLPE